MALNENALVASLSIRHGVSEDAVRTVLNALRSGNGTMAQFTHPEFGGMAQWSTGMTMVGDMFNDKVKARLNAIATDLASYLRENPMAGEGEAQVSYRSRSRPFQSWWPDCSACRPRAAPKTIFATPSFQARAAWSSRTPANLSFMTPASTESPGFRKRRVPKPRSRS